MGLPRHEGVHAHLQGPHGHRHGEVYREVRLAQGELVFGETAEARPVLFQWKDGVVRSDRQSEGGL